MDSSIWLKLGGALLLIMVLWRAIPMARYWFKNGPKGSSQDWMSALVPIVAVIGFVILLILMVSA